MFKKTFVCLFAIVCCCGIDLSGASIPFHGGKLMAAELSTAKPQLNGFKPEIYSNLPQNQIYAKLVFTLSTERKISMFDYALELFGTRYPAVAVAGGDGVWHFDGRAVDWKSNSELYSLLFILDRNITGSKDVEKATLLCCPPEHKLRRQEIPLHNRAGAGFSSLSAVKGGIMRSLPE